MFFKQFYLGCLAHGSYLLGSEGEAAVIDPQRDVDQYIEEAGARGLTIKYIIETHLHADFVSGHRELAERTGAQIVFGKVAVASFPHVGVTDGDTIKVGGLELKFYETPGHTPESICILVKDTGDTSTPQRLFTGDTLFIGDVGRPDLVAVKGHTAQEMAGLMYESLHSKLLKLDDAIEVYPAHGAGSLCGKHLSDEKSSTIGKEKKFNYALKPMSKESFIAMMTADLPEVPAYFPKDVEINRQGAAPLGSIARPQPLDGAVVAKEMQRGAIVLDVRSAVEYAGAHIKGSLNIGLGGQFASWAGTLIKIGTPIILLTNDIAKVDEAVMRLARVGFETVVGYVENGISGWSDSGFEAVPSLVMTVDELKRTLDKGEEIRVIDVRRPGEFENGHVPNAINIPLAYLPERIVDLPAGTKLALICASGYRSIIAMGVVERSGLMPSINIVGGTSAWKAQGYEVVIEHKAVSEQTTVAR